MTPDTDRPEKFDDHGGERPNASPELQDAIRSIDAIGENAWGKDDDEDAPRGADRTATERTGTEGTGTETAATDPSLEDSPEGNPDAP
jgi:hypothetical protein